MRETPGRSNRASRGFCITWSSVVLFRLDVDAAATQQRCWITRISQKQLVVVDDGAGVVQVPDLDTELVRATAAVLLAVDRGEQETVVPRAVDGADALELCLGAGH